MTDLPVEAPLEEERPAEEQRVVGYWTMEDTERLFIIIHTNPGVEKPWSVIGEKLLRTAEDCEKWYKYVITAHSQIPEEDRRAYSGVQHSSRKRKRRKANTVERQFHCQVSNCRKSYGTEGALKFHVTHKHPGVKYIPSYLTPYNSTYKDFAMFNGQPDANMMTASALSVMNSMDQAGTIRHVVDQMAAENGGMTFEIHAADLEQLQAQAQAELAQEGEGQQDHVMEEDHGEPQTPNEEMPEAVQEEMPSDQGQGTVEGEPEQTDHEGEGQVEHIEHVEHEHVEQVEQVEHVEHAEHVEHIEHIEQENTEGMEGEAEQ